MPSGWIKLHRELQNSDMYRSLNAVQRDVMIQCLLMANHSDREWEWKGLIQRCRSGQFKTSLEHIKEKCAKGTTIRMLRTALKKLEKWQFLTQNTTKKGRIITIINWSAYQSQNSEQGKDSGKQRAYKGQRGGKQRATNKKVKNEKKYAETSVEFQLVSFACQQIKKTHQHIKFAATILQKACNDFDKLMRVDGKSEDEIRAVLEWLPNAPRNNGFSWADQIQSPLKLRRKNKDHVSYIDLLMSSMRNGQVPEDAPI